MRKVLEIMKSEFNNSKDSVQIVSGVLTLLLSIISLITKVFESKYAIALLLLGLFLIAQRVCKEIISSTKESFGVITQSYSANFIILAKVGKYFSWLFLIFPIYLISTIFLKKEGCETKEAQLGILITSFSVASDDDFSYKLFNLLESELQNVDTLKALKLDQFISVGKAHSTDTIKNYYSKNCLNRGLLVFGKRSDQSRLFDCNIYIHNVYNLNVDSSNMDKNILFLRNPDMLNFSIDSQANIVADFILGLLYYNAGRYHVSRVKFNRAAELSSSYQDTKFKSYCYFFNGNNLLRESKVLEAINSYKEGLLYDSLNAFLHYNLATALLIRLDSSNAYNAYENAKRISSAFLNPLKSYFKQNHGNILHGELNEKGNKKTVNDNAPQISIVNSGGVNESKKIGASEFSVVKFGEKYGVVNSDGKVVVPYEFDFIETHNFNYQGYRFFIVQKAGKFGAVSAKGILEVPTIHPSADYVMGILKVSIDYDPTSVNH